VLFVDVMTNAAGLGGSDGALRKLSERATPSAIVLLTSVIELLDIVVEQGEVYKVETVGSCYMAVSGLPIGCPQPSNTSQCMLRVAVAMMDSLRTSTIENVGLQRTLRTRCMLRTGISCVNLVKFCLDCARPETLLYV
jgi:hypothetical protein